MAETQRRTSERAAAVAMRPTVAPWPRPPLELLLPPDQQPLGMGGYLKGAQLLTVCVNNAALGAWYCAGRWAGAGGSTCVGQDW